jgi:pyruvate carboxylase
MARRHCDVSLLPTDVFFYGLQDLQEISVDIDVGKTLVIRLQAKADAQEQGVVKLFYELNGQPRTIRVARAGGKAAAERPKAEEGNLDQIGAPIPGMVVRIAVQPGQAVEKGEALLVLEAMKMETVISAPRRARVRRVLVEAGVPVASRDLLVEFENP